MSTEKALEIALETLARKTQEIEALEKEVAALKAAKVRVPVKKWVDDEGLSFQARFLRLKAHHEEETKWLISEIERLQRNKNNGP